MSNSIEPDETAHYEPSHLDLCCLQKFIIIAYGSERVKHVYLYNMVTNMLSLSLSNCLDIKLLCPC